MLIFAALQAARCYVIVSLRRGFVALRFSGKPFSHIALNELEAAG
jgi:hypothetical protein